MRKGQSAMEYLMTYGWAILVIVIVIAVLFYIGVLNPANVTPVVCTFPPGFSCASYKLASNGTLDLKIGQATGHRVQLTGIACTQALEPQNWTTLNINISNGLSAYLGEINCTTEEGEVAIGANGDTSKFRVWMNYSELDSGGKKRQIAGDITARYEP